MNKIILYILGFFISIGILGMLYITQKYTNPSVEIDYLNIKRYLLKNITFISALYIHIFSAIVCIIAGILQFIPGIFRRFKKIHIYIGVIYAVTVIVFAAPSGFVLALYASGGKLAMITFAVSAILWWSTSIIAIKYINEKNYLKHIQFNIFSYALTCTAITLRIYTSIAVIIHPPFSSDVQYTFIALLSTIGNLLFAFLLIKINLDKYLLNKFLRV